MKKKTYKAIKNRMYNFMCKEAMERGRRIRAEEKAAFYERRFRELGSNVETVEPETGPVATLIWNVESQTWGQYSIVTETPQDDMVKHVSRKLIESIADGLIQQNLVQIIVRDGDLPFEQHTIAAKLYVVPWDRMPHERTIKIKQFIDETLGGGAHGKI